MNNLFFGGSSNIALQLAKKFKNTDSVSLKKNNNVYYKVFKIDNYNVSSLNKLQKKLLKNMIM